MCLRFPSIILALMMDIAEARSTHPQNVPINAPMK
jgi:hypothetical protein